MVIETALAQSLAVADAIVFGLKNYDHSLVMLPVKASKKKKYGKNCGFKMSEGKGRERERKTKLMKQ